MSQTTLAPTDRVQIELLYLDAETCDPCRATIVSAERAASELREALAGRGVEVDLRLTHVSDPEQARALGFVSSPTVRVDGREIAVDVEEAHCGTCSENAGEPIACRTVSYAGERHDHAPTAMIVEAVLAHLRGAELPAPAPGDERATSVARYLAAIERQGEAHLELRARIRGDVLVAGDEGWVDARAAYNTVVDQRPAMVAVPADAADVVEIVRFAGERDLTVVPQRTGHNAEPLGSVEGTILLRTDRMREVEIDPVARLARVGAGAKWEDVVPIASDLGLAALHGSTPDVSIAGFSLGGGVGWYARALGLAANSVTGIEIVTADARRRWVDHEHEPDLFWALRGGGGNFGVVTALEFRLHEMPELYAGVLFFPWERSAEVLHAWNAWTRTVPERTTSVGRMIRFPASDDVPQRLRGRGFALVEMFHIGGEEEGSEVLAPLRALGPEFDTMAMVPPVGIAETHMDPPDPLPYAVDHQVLADLTPEAIDHLVAAVGPGSGSELMSVEIRHLGGAAGREGPGAGALARLPGEYLILGIDVTPDEETAATVRARLRTMLASTAELASGLYLNFTEHRIDTRRLFSGETYARLQAVRRRVDPDGRFRANHVIPPAPAPSPEQG
jgi:UDP-N-acetylenolpyruvoylglucosamine reductase